MTDKIVAYHCRHCGAPVDPEQEICGFCNKPVQYNGRVGKRMARVLIDSGNDFVYFDQITEIESQPIQNEISYRTADGYLHRVIENPRYDISVKMPMTERSMELLSTLNFKKRYTVKIEIANIQTYEMQTFIEPQMPDISLNEIVMNELKLYQDSDIKNYFLKVPDGVFCPNCGALLKSRYGACDYCNGWVEYLGQGW